MPKPVLLVVLDGWGYREDTTNNAIAAANTPFFRELWNNNPHSLLQASGLAVGLPEGQMGNSEVGHTTIGAGNAVLTDLVRISKAASEGDFDTNQTFLDLFKHVREHDSVLHLMGLLSPGGVHSHEEHLYAIIRAAKNYGLKKVAIHCFTDGRDTPPKSAADDIERLENQLSEIGIGSVASIGGRYYAMDRDKNWDRTDKMAEVLFESQVPTYIDRRCFEVVNEQYNEEITDEYLIPHRVIIFGQEFKISTNDAVFNFNFRPDRARQITRKVMERMVDLNLKFATMTEYDSSFKLPVAFPAVEIKTTLGKEIANAGLSQAHIAETEKYAHATYFLNGGQETPYQKETDVLLDSHKDVPTHDKAPEMRAESIADKAIEQIEANNDFIFINFANPDMVGHTGNVPAIITAVETVDTNLKRVVEAIRAKGGVCLITADHGNAELNIDPETGAPHTAHTTNPVPFIVDGVECSTNNGTLADLAPTVLHLLDLPIPESMTGSNLLNI